MLIRQIWHSRLLILCCGFLLFTAGCGLSEMFGGSNAEKITEPCIELIPLTTPTLAPEKTPQPSDTPTPSQTCENAPGIVLICDGEPVDDTPITVITPPTIITEPPVIITEPPIVVSYMLHVFLITEPAYSTACPSTQYSVSPPGIVLPSAGYDLTVSSGSSTTFVISPLAAMSCSGMNITVSPTTPYTPPAVGFPKTVTVGPITQETWLTFEVAL